MKYDGGKGVSISWSAMLGGKFVAIDPTRSMAAKDDNDISWLDECIKDEDRGTHPGTGRR